MNFEEGKRWLTRANSIDREISELEDEIGAYESCLICAGVSYDRSKIITSPENHFEIVMCDIAECFTKIQKLNEKRMVILQEINQKLDKLPESPERYILRAFYVKHRRMDDIAKALGYEEHYCYELRKKGIEKL